MTISIEDLEHAAAAGWRACETGRLGSWLLRAAEGFTGRANSALAAGDPGLPLAAALEQICSWYSERGLPPMIAVPYPPGQPAASHLDRVLADLGWAVRADAATVMTADADVVAAQAGQTEVALDAEPDADWLARYHYRGQQLPPVAVKLLTSAPWQAFGSVRSGGETIAIGRVAQAGDWAGLTAIEVEPRFRRKGLGTVVTRALAAAAVKRSASSIYLQVTDGNTGARALYRRLGFTDHHGYHYRVAPA
ncbi:MAG TPA: GNAT family N-acetyltransferase [Streptosporangiaceae bacterium]|nr:GNAT family N-acetyltransferase [Streptosporangiaceae bacterium]